MKAVREIQMGKSLIRKNLLRSAVAVAATVALVGHANAAQFRGTWDPVYLGVPQIGDPFKNDGTYLYFSGEVVVDTGTCSVVPSSLLTSCPDWKVLSAKLVLGESDVNGIPTPGGASQTMTFAPPTNSITIAGLYFDANSKLTGMDTDWFTPGKQGNTNATLATWLTYSNQQPYFSLSFFEESVVMGWKLSSSPGGWSCTGAPTSVEKNLCGSDVADVVYAPIPEPSTYALMGLGLAAVAAMRRRATRKAAQA